jgi:TRAP-type C4-dicarboxylate transport system substrate-binding protein
MPGRMPLGAVAELSGGYPDACTGTKALLDVVLPGGLLDELEFAPAGVTVLAAVVLPPYQAGFASDSIDTLEGIKGKKLRSNPGPMEMTAETLGGVPVRMTPSEIYDSLEKGTIDGFFLPYVSILSYKLEEATKTVTRGANFGSVVITYGIDTDRLKKLPENISAALTQAGKEVSLSGCAQFDAEEAEAGEQLKAAGIEFLDFQANDAAQLDATLTKLGDD